MAWDERGCWFDICMARKNRTVRWRGQMCIRDRLNEAVKYIANEQVDKACDMFERMIDKYPNDAWLMCKLAYIYEGYANDKDMAKKYYDRAYEVDPDLIIQRHCINMD